MSINQASPSLPSPSEARALRIEAGLSQEKLAQRIGCTTRTLLDWEWGRVTPHPLMRPKYARVLAELKAGSSDR